MSLRIQSLALPVPDLREWHAVFPVRHPVSSLTFAGRTETFWGTSRGPRSSYDVYFRINSSLSTVSQSISAYPVPTSMLFSSLDSRDFQTPNWPLARLILEYDQQSSSPYLWQYINLMERMQRLERSRGNGGLSFSQLDVNCLQINGSYHKGTTKSGLLLCPTCGMVLFPVGPVSLTFYLQNHGLRN